VYFVTQNPLDIPDTVLGQLGNRVQHALRAFTPRDQKAVKAAASTMRANPTFDAEAAISELAVGEALVSFLDEKGRPNIVERAFVVPPGTRIGPVNDAERKALVAGSVVAGIYDETVDRESAYERLRGRAGGGTVPGKTGAGPATGTAGDASAAGAGESAQGGGWADMLGGLLGGGGKGRSDSVLEAAAKSAARSMATTAGRELVRGVLGTLLGASSTKRRR
jgi:DNA helicase HerA-like ATPase